MFSRRSFVQTGTLAALSVHMGFSRAEDEWTDPQRHLRELERDRVLRQGRAFLKQVPKTITAVRAERSPGGLHDFYSEGDYWWPDPKNPHGPYIRRDGETNPDNFVAHRELLMRLSLRMPALTAAWVLTGHRDFAAHASTHLRAWFVEPNTRMNPNLQYAQAIHGIDQGRSIGIIDTVHLAEVAQATLVLAQSKAIDPAIESGTRAWFTEYVHWLTTSAHGQQERDEKNNHGSCWVLQAACFATLTRIEEIRVLCRERFLNTLIQNQIATDGSLPLELSRTKPYGYCLFDLDILGITAQVLSDASHNLWTHRSDKGASLEDAFRFMAPFIKDKSAWPYRHDVQYFDDLPVRQPSLLFAGLAYHRPDYLELWARLNPDPIVPEVIRNHPVRQPILWI